MYRYEREWGPDATDFSIELLCFRNKLRIEDGGLGAEGHFKNIVGMLWPEDSSSKVFVWSPYAEEMLEEACRVKYLSVTGFANSGKTEFFAVWSIINFLADPIRTLILVTSTSLKESKKRIWGAIEDWWRAAQKNVGGGLPGNLVSSIGEIRLDDEASGMKSTRAGIYLVAGEKRKEKEAMGKLIGAKNIRVFLIADELPELSPSLITAAISNLDSNDAEGLEGRMFQMVGLGNAASIYDPHGWFSKPKGGWKTVTPEMTRWETDLGIALHFDVETSPNVVLGTVIYPWMPSREKVEEKKRQLGENSLEYWRMWRGYWCPTGSSEGVWSEADIVKFDAEETTVDWHSVPISMSSLDPGWTNGGDMSAVVFAQFGMDTSGKQVLLYTGYKYLHEDAMKVGQPRDFQIAKQFKDESKRKGVMAENASYDATGGGLPFGSIIAQVWSPQVQGITWSGKASTKPASMTEKAPSVEKYFNRASEMWYRGKDYLQGRQIKGVFPDLGSELVSRKGTTVKGKQIVARVEDKATVRSRTGKSPNIADAALMILDHCVKKFHFKARAQVRQNLKGRASWNKFVRRLDVTTRSGNFLER